MSTTAATAPAKAALPNEGRPGYKHTKLGWIPEEWEAVPLDSVVSKGKPIMYGIVQAGPHIEDGVPYIKSTDIAKGQIIPDSLQRTTPEIAAKYKRSIVIPGDIIFSLRGDLPSTAIVPEELKEANLTQGTARISVSKDFLNTFVDASLHAPLVARRINLLAKGSTFQEITLTDLRKVEIAKPKDLPEQRRIAAVLGAWDRAIATAQQLLAAQQERKRGLMQELLTGKRRFPGFGEKWKSHRLGDLFERVTRKNTVGEEHVLTISAQHGLIDQREIFNKSVAGANLGGYYLLKNGEFAYNKSSSNGFPFGAIKRLDRYAQGVLSTLYICFRLKPNAGNSDFLAAYFDSGMLDQGISMVAQEGARNHGLLNISSADFFDIDMRIPPADEQSAIAKAIGTLNAETAALTNYLDHLTTQKRGLMQQLLTGAVRVKH